MSEERPFSHLDARGRARMVDVSAEAGDPPRGRSFVPRASGRRDARPPGANCPRATRSRWRESPASRRRSARAEWIPLAHRCRSTRSRLDFERVTDGLAVRSRVVVTARTGAEMEALVACAAAALALYDMVKAVERGAEITDLRLEAKSGGRLRGDWAREPDDRHRPRPPARRPVALAGRRFGLLAHGASLTRSSCRRTSRSAQAGRPPARLFGPEHGYYGVEQDMVASATQRDPWTGAPIVSLYGDDEKLAAPAAARRSPGSTCCSSTCRTSARATTPSPRPRSGRRRRRSPPARGLDPRPPEPARRRGGRGQSAASRASSRSSAPSGMPVRHGLTLGEIVAARGARRGFGGGARASSRWRAGGARALWPQLGRPWIAPSPNMPTFDTALVYPGLCLIEATELSEGRGTTRPFRLVGAPGRRPGRARARARRRARRSACAPCRPTSGRSSRSTAARSAAASSSRSSRPRAAVAVPARRRAPGRAPRRRAASAFAGGARRLRVRGRPAGDRSPRRRRRPAGARSTATATSTPGSRRGPTTRRLSAKSGGRS